MKCCKCGSDKFNIQYIATWDSNGRRDKEHLHYYCQCCSYDWTGLTLDAKNLLDTAEKP